MSRRWEHSTRWRFGTDGESSPALDGSTQRRVPASRLEGRLSVPPDRPGAQERGTAQHPISVVTLDGERYIVSAFSEADWVKNVRAAGTASLRRGSQVEAVGLVELPDVERDPVLRAFLRQVPGGVRFFASSEPDAVVAAASRYPVFRVVLV